MQILIVDDNDDIRRVFDLAFTSAGHQIKTAATGAEALVLVKSHQFDAVLMDVEMPTMSGWNVLEAIHNMPSGGNLPVVLFTAHGNVTSDAYAKMLGAYALLRKPVGAAELLDVITRAIEERNI